MGSDNAAMVKFKAKKVAVQAPKEAEINVQAHETLRKFTSLITFDPDSYDFKLTKEFTDACNAAKKAEQDHRAAIGTTTNTT